jgi:hypothetical protein
LAFATGFAFEAALAFCLAKLFAGFLTALPLRADGISTPFYLDCAGR